MYKHNLLKTPLQDVSEELFDKLLAAFYIYMKDVLGHPFAYESETGSVPWDIATIRNRLAPNIMVDIDVIMTRKEGIYLGDRDPEYLLVSLPFNDAESIARTMGAAYLKAANSDLDFDSLSGLTQTVRNTTRPTQFRRNGEAQSIPAGVE